MWNLTRLMGVLPLLVALWAAPLAQAQNAALRSGDTIEVRVAGIPAEEIHQINGQYNIDENGKINLPYIGLMSAAGLQANQLQRAVEESFKANKIFTNPTITVSPTGARLVNVGGAGIRSPQRIAYTPDLTLMSAINAAGGFNDFGDRKKVSLIRDGKVTVIDTRVLAKDPSKDPAVKPGDQINVPMSLGLF